MSHHVKELDASTARCHTHAQDCDECDAWRKRKTTLPCPNPIQEAFLLHQDVLTQWHLKHLQMHHTHAWHLISITHEHTHTPHPDPCQDSRPEYRSLHTHRHTHTYSHVHTHTPALSVKLRQKLTGALVFALHLPLRCCLSRRMKMLLRKTASVRLASVLARAAAHRRDSHVRAAVSRFTRDPVLRRPRNHGCGGVC